MVDKLPACGEGADIHWQDSSGGSEKASESTAGGGVVYAVFFGKVGCFSTRTATSLLLKAEETMQARLKAGGSHLQVVVCASDARDTSRQRSETFRCYLEGLHSHWRAVPLAQSEELQRSMVKQLGGGASAAGLTSTPQLLFLDSNGRVLVDDGIRHLSLDRAAVGFPWAPAGGGAASARDGSVRHLVTSLTLARAPQAGPLTGLLLLPAYDSPHAVPVAEQCALLDRYREVAASVVQEYHTPPGQTCFLYSSEKEMWQNGLAHLVKAGIAPPDLLKEVQKCTDRNGGGGAALVMLWSERLPGGGTGACYAAVPVDSPDSSFLDAKFMVHPGLGFQRR
ncbi:hypothetical protein JKP88DRAFT_265777 [Tribonema minus]|uniref:Uncharacterized protein n=1 Tax=Tribonema minus TaxID=303371 RepID=A0A835YJ80_9STRA|nr:hypothetical protein JKP88DRAFT_265777 [Tribonema minus]